MIVWNRISGYELFVLDRNTWNYINVYKQMIIIELK